MSAFENLEGPCDLLLRGGTLIDAESEQVADLAVRDGKIAAISPSLDLEADRVIDATRHFLLPGFLDAHVHFNEPGRTEWEGFTTGSSALAAGGGTAFLDMPLNSSPPVLDGASFDAKAEALQAHSVLDGGIWGGLVPGNLGHLAELAERGVIGFKAFLSNSGLEEFPRADAVTLRQGMEQAAELGLLVAVHAESEEMTGKLAHERQKKGATGIRDYLESRPIEAELEAVGMALDVARETGCALHVVHVSSAAGLKLISEGKAAGIDATAETCPHYLLLNEDDLFRLGPVAKCAPPLRSAAEQKLLWDALEAGLIDTIGSDHSPAPPEMKKDSDFFKIWGGISGCQHAFPLFFERAVLERKIAPSVVARLTSHQVAERFRLPNKGRLLPGYDADLVVLAIDNPMPIQESDLLYRHPQSPYVGRSTRVRVVETIARGQSVFSQGKIGHFHPAKILRTLSP